ncbi:MAG: heavy-metal-associated domain-containing protein [Bacteroidales bacterium]|nr:heavy-metal-associated domain-containing protein [Bacteroidales bacterium]
MKKLFLIAMITLVSVVASAKDIKTVYLTTDPVMHCNSCEVRIKENLKYVKGIKSIKTDVATQTVTVTYDADKTTVQKIKDSLKKIQYVATEKEPAFCDAANKTCDGKQEGCCQSGAKQQSKGCSHGCK